MVVGERLRVVREKKNLSQGEVESRTGLLRCYISRVENGHTANVVVMKPSSENPWGSTGKDAAYFNELRRLLSKIGASDRKLVLHMAQKMANR